MSRSASVECTCICPADAGLVQRLSAHGRLAGPGPPTPGRLLRVCADGSVWCGRMKRRSFGAGPLSASCVESRSSRIVSIRSAPRLPDGWSTACGRPPMRVDWMPPLMVFVGGARTESVRGHTRSSDEAGEHGRSAERACESHESRTPALGKRSERPLLPSREGSLKLVDDGETRIFCGKEWDRHRR